MKLKLNTFLALIIATFLSQGTVSAQFDDLYYDPDRDQQLTQESEYVDDDGYYDVDEYNYEDDYYYDDYDYATRINRFRRPARYIDYYSACYLNNSWNTWGYDPFFSPFYGGSAFAININIGNSWGFNRWNRWNRYNNWGWGPSWGSTWSNWGWNSWNRWNAWGPSYGYGNNIFYTNNYYGNNGYGNSYWNNGNNGYYNSYDRATNPNGRYYGSRKGGSSVSSVNGRLRSPRATNDYITSRVTEKRTGTVSSTKGTKSYRRGDIAVNNSSRTNRIYNKDRRDRNTYRGTTNSRTIDRGSSRTINRGSSRTINRGSSKTINRGSSRTINRGNTSKSINRNRNTTRTRSVSPRNNTSRSNRSINSSRSSNRSSSSMNRSSSRSSSSKSTSRSSSSRKRNN